MPDFTFRGASGGQSPGLYPMLRDGFGVLVGTAEPGDIARFDEAPDADWELYEGGGGEDEDPPGDPGSEQDDDPAGSGQEEAD